MIPVPICQMQNFEGTAACNLNIEFIRLSPEISDFSRCYQLTEIFEFSKSQQLFETSDCSRNHQLSKISEFSRSHQLSEIPDLSRSLQLFEIFDLSRSRQLSENLEKNDESPFELNLSVGVAYLGGHFGSFGSAQNDSGIGQ